MTMETVHGIAIRRRDDNKLVEFIECACGRIALRVLSGVRMNLDSDYKAEEEFVPLDEIRLIEERGSRR